VIEMVLLLFFLFLFFVFALALFRLVVPKDSTPQSETSLFLRFNFVIIETMEDHFCFVLFFV
jgi:hypothetical protein